MKYIVITGVVIGAALVAWTFRSEAIEYAPNIPQVIEKEVTVEVNPLDEQIKIREQELEEKYNKIKSVEARVDVLKAERERLDAEISSLQKELAGFMTATTSGR